MKVFNTGNIADFYSIKELVEHCKYQTEEDCALCAYNIKHKGCYFRQGKTPNEWEVK